MGINNTNEFNEENFREAAEMLLRLLTYLKTGAFSMIVAVLSVGTYYWIAPYAPHYCYAWAFFISGGLSNVLFDEMFPYDPKNNEIHINKMVKTEKKNRGIDTE